MNDELLFDRLASHEEPAALDTAFEARLYSILEREMRRGRSLRPALLLAATLLLVLTITAALAVGSGLIKLPWVDRSPIPTPPTELAWLGPVRPDGRGMLVHPMAQHPTGEELWYSSDGRDAASGWVDITHLTTRDPARNWSLQLTARPPTLDALAATDQTLAYGVVLETTGDDVADWLIGIDNDVPDGDFRQWITDLSTGRTDEHIGPPYGGMPFFDFAHPSEGALSGEGRSSMLFFFLGDPREWGTSIRFYAWSSLTQADEVIAWDYAPDAAWLAVPVPEQ